MHPKDGGYDAGYSAVPCFWGTDPGSLVAKFIADFPPRPRTRVLDLGCGEGKNAVAFASAGCWVDAIDCSELALSNAKRAFPSALVNWHVGDATTIDFSGDSYDIVVMYGLLHCFSSISQIVQTIDRAQKVTRLGGHHIVCSFNDRSQDLSAHPGFHPLLARHQWYLQRYSDWTIIDASDSDLTEVHPHNMIRHHHSLTRLLARKPN